MLRSSTVAFGFNGFVAGSSLFIMALGASPALAQDDVRLAGVVGDERTSTPVASAKVTILGTELETVSGADGTFAFSEAPLGPVTVRVEVPGYPTVNEEVVVQEGAVVFVQFILPSVDAFLDEILVLGRSTGASTPLSESRTAADLLVGQIPAASVSPGEVGLDRSEVRLRGVSSISVRSEPAVYLDGVRMAGGFGEALAMLRQIPANDVRDIQLLRGPAAAFVYGAADGAILIRTRSGSESQGPND